MKKAWWISITIVAVGALVAATVYAIRMEGPEVKRGKLTPEEERVIVHKGTEPPFSGKYWNFDGDGVYTCRRCGAPLYDSKDKFNSRCGWPSFDDEIPGAVKRQPDADGRRTEIICAKCGAHLGHVFTGEHFTPKNTRFCVNSLSMNFIPRKEWDEMQMKKKQKQSAVTPDPKLQKAIFAGGCFWGVEALLKKEKGVVDAVVGYTGGHTAHPTYREVCSGTTGHLEAVEVTYDPSIITYEELCTYFFDIHDPTEGNRQGPDVGEQYGSAVFYLNDEQKAVAEKLISELESKGYEATTAVREAGRFWKAENYHQDYYERTGKTPYCHIFKKRL